VTKYITSWTINKIFGCTTFQFIYRGADKSLARPGRKQATATEDSDMFIYPIYNYNWRNIITIYNITRLASNEIFSP